MGEKQFRQTKQRRFILEELRKLKIHPTAEELFLELKKKMPNISFSTVYRNLSFLKNKGEILEINLGKYSSRYDGDINPHQHFFCLSCKKVFDISFPLLDERSLDNKIIKRIEKKLNCIVKYKRIDFYGYCKDCKKIRRRFYE